jgi:ABC-type Fe3+ transport system substrate-binding protein
MENYLNELNADSYGSFIPLEGTTDFIEYGAILKNSNHQILAKNFLNYVISDEFQINVFAYKRLFPTNKNIKLNFGIPQNYKLYKLPYSKAQVVKQLPLWKKRWEKLIK